MKTLIAFRYSNEDIKIIEPILIAVKSSLEVKGIETYCTFFSKDLDDTLLKPKDWMKHAFKIIDNIDFLFVVQHSSNKSEGMLMEVGYCLAKKIPIVVATKQGIQDTYLPTMASTNFNWKTINDLKQNISNCDFKKLTTKN